MQVSADGGTPEVLIPREGTGEIAHGPQVLPGEKVVLFTLRDDPNWDDAQIVVHSLEIDESKVLIEGGRDARYVPTGQLVYVLDGTLWAVLFEVDKLEVTGGAIPMVEGVMTASDITGAAHFSVSDTGALVYVAGSDPGERTLVWVDRDSREEALAAGPRTYRYPCISPDGGCVAFSVSDEENDIWSWDFARETLTRLTFAPGRDIFSVWTPDGRQVAFSSACGGSENLYWKAADGTGAVECLTESENRQYPYAFTPDGRQLVFREIDEQGIDLGMLSLEGSSEPLLATEFAERNTEISPDGRKLFYLAPGPRLKGVGIQTEPSFAPGNDEVPFEGRFLATGPPGRTYDIFPDGERFLMIKESAGVDSTEFITVINWFEELKARVATDN